MVCEDHKQERFILRNYYGEWKVESAPSSEVIPIVNTLKGGSLDGVNVNDLADGTIVMVGGESAVVPVVEDSETSVESQEENTQVNTEDYPEFDGIKWFNPAEFKCKCSDPNCIGKTGHMKHELLVILDRCRERFDVPIRINSAYRCPSHNAAVGGVSGSRHKFGKAADIVANGISSYTVSAWLKTQSDVRYTYDIDATAVHVDVL